MSFKLLGIPLRPTTLKNPFTAYTSHAFSTSSTTQYRKPHSCRTLQPHLLQPSDLIDLSERKKATITSGNSELRAHLVYCYQPNLLRAPFPPNTQGFLYYHHLPNTPPASGEIRFRVTSPDDPSNFARGTDLLTPGFMPWAINTLALARPSNLFLKKILLREGLSDQKTLERVTAGRPSDQILFYLEQPFVMGLQHQVLLLHVVSASAFGEVRLHRLVREYREGASFAPYRGHVLLRFERSTLPEHSGARVLVLRVLKILDPITLVDPHYDMHAPPPVEGELLRKKWRRGKKYPILYLDLDNCAECWKDLGLLLAEHKHNAPQDESEKGINSLAPHNRRSS